MTEKTTAKFKEKLQKELELLEVELKTVGRRNPSNPNDWEPVPGEEEINYADKNEQADQITNYETNTAIVKDLEIKYNEVKDALQKMGSGKFGKCEICGADIEEDRLGASPSARTCKAHMGGKI